MFPAPHQDWLTSPAKTAAVYGNPNAMADARAATHLAKAAARIVTVNISVNLLSIQYQQFFSDHSSEIQQLIQQLSSTDEYLPITG